MEKQNAPFINQCSILSLIGLFYFCSTLISCSKHISNILHPSPSNNVSLLGKKGELEATAKYNTSMNALVHRQGRIDNVEMGVLQLTYAATAHLGLMVNAAYGKKKSLQDWRFFDEFEGQDKTTLLKKYQYLDAELGLGWFTKIGAKQNGRFNIFGGMGLGKSMTTGRLIRLCEADQERRSLIGKHKGDYLQFFVQPTIGFVRDNIEIGFACSATYLSYDLAELSSLVCTYAQEVKNDFLVEPSVSMKIGIKNVKLVTEYKNLVYLPRPSHEINHHVFVVGLQFQFNALKHN